MDATAIFQFSGAMIRAKKLGGDLHCFTLGFFWAKLVNLLCHTTTIDEEVSEVAAAKQQWMTFCISKLIHETASRQCPWSAWVLPVPTTHSRLFANILLRRAYTKYNWNVARAQTAQVMSGSHAIVNWLTTELSGRG